MTMKPTPQKRRRAAVRTCLAAMLFGVLGLFVTACINTNGPQISSNYILPKVMKDPSCVTRDVALPKEYDHVSSTVQPLRLTLINVKKPVSGTSYRAFLNKPDATKDTPVADPHCLGSISFYGTANENDFVFDAGRTLEKLRQDAAYKPSETVTVTLVPTVGGEPIQLDDARLVVPN